MRPKLKFNMYYTTLFDKHLENLFGLPNPAPIIINYLHLLGRYRGN